MTEVFACVVTYKRPETLRACLDSLLRQPELSHIHVIANSTDQSTAEVINEFKLSRPGFVSSVTLNNAGPAGGFHYGLKKFLEGTYQFAWLMDDDVVAGAGSLSELLRCSQGHSYVYPRVIKKSGEEVVSFGWWGVLLGRDLVSKAGLPLIDLFYWAEDTEYLQNRLMRVHGVKPYRCQGASVEHLHFRNAARPSWYYYYMVRNTLYYRIYLQKNNLLRRITRTLYLFIYVPFKIFSERKNTSRKLRLFLLGFYHGIRGRTGKLIDPEVYR